ncbi:MAG: molybdopterin cofactor-binding domain-containing protein, partial [Rhodospirillaceae bacterium]
TTTFGKVAAVAAKQPVPEKVKLKGPKDWTIAGKPMKRLDTADKLTGKQVYGIDVKLPGMVNAAIRQYPLFGATLKSFDASKAQSMPGVKKVLAVGGNAVAVVADTWWQAKTALDAVETQWDDGPHARVDSADIAAMVREGLDAKDAFVGNKVGDAKAAIAKSPKRIEATYSYPFQHHATMEPMNATAVWTPEKCDVWCPTQSAESALQVVAKAAELDPAFCTIHRMHLGGGFGRRGAGPIHDYATQAVEIAKAMPGTPVKLLWSREEDMTHGAYHPVTQCRLSAGLDENGDITGLHVRISGQSILAGIMPGRLKNGMDIVTFQCLLPKGDHAISYDFPNLLVDHAMRNPHLRPGFWRGVNANHNVIYLESFMDELAKAAGQDPLAFRLKYMAKYPKNQAVLKAVAEKAGWGTPAPKGVFRGLAHCKAFASYVAACAEVSVSDGGMVKIHRIVAATDTGHAVNPQQIEAQVEGSFVYGLSAMLMGECTVKAGRVEQQNFDRYEVMRIKDMPKVETTVM